MYCSSKLHTSTLPSQSQLASQLSSPVHMLRSYCHFQFTVLEVIFLTLTYLSEDWVVGIPEPVCAQTQKSVDSCSRILAPDVTSSDVGSSLLAHVCFHFTLCFCLLIALEAMFFGLKACVSWEPNSCRTYLTKKLSLLILFTLGVLLGLVLGMPRGPSAVPGMTESFLAYIILSKSFVRHGSQHALAEETVTKHSRNLHERRTGVSQSEPEDARARHFCVMGRSSRK